MKTENVKLWVVGNGVAKPVNPHNPFTEIAFNPGRENQDWKDFEQLAQQHTFATSAPPGIHSAEMFGEVKYQILNQTGKNGIYQDCSKEDFERWVGFMPRNFLPFKYPVEPNDKQSSAEEMTNYNADAVFNAIQNEFVHPLNPNANAIKIVSERVNYYGNKGDTSKAGENKDFAIWNELQHILKLLQS